MVQRKEDNNSDVKTDEKKVTSETSKGTGSRRIFSPVFKLQVLDSYRQDADCQGNQRATARKYGIHRRQIQKWLQMEANLRVSVQQSKATAVALNLSPVKFDDKIDECNAAKNPIYLNQNTTVKTECKSDDEEYVNVDEITDSEDEETSSCPSYDKSDKALDFTSATLSKRRFYSSEFKLLVIEAFKTDQICKGNQRATARKFGIHRRQVQKWLNQEDMIKSEQRLGNSCLDLSHKRKLGVEEDHSQIPTLKKSFTEVQNSALCLVKNHPLEESNNYHQVVYPSPPLGNSFRNYVPHEYPLCVYQQPWICCCPPFSASPKYTYSFDFKCDNSSYVDIPVQYGFGDSILSTWVKDNPLNAHESPSIRVLSSYRFSHH